MPSERIPRQVRRAVVERAHAKCEYCLSPSRYARQPFDVDHIVPRSQGGQTDLDNLCLACGCNVYKGALTQGRDPETGETTALFHPRRQLWTDHFEWTVDYERISGRTPTGRATIEALRLNRPELVLLRRILRRVGEHPPVNS